ncbi:cGMP phosphodiesterase [Cladochytrium replicatum]|nr:cGMP phosphodiesterase [Cladochytrium replicatum]
MASVAKAPIISTAKTPQLDGQDSVAADPRASITGAPLLVKIYIVTQVPANPPEFELEDDVNAAPPSPISPNTPSPGTRRKRYKMVDRSETVLISRRSTVDEIRSCMLTAADIPPHLAADVTVKLRSTDGSTLIPLGPNLPTNTLQSQYRLEIDYGRLFPDPAYVNEQDINRHLKSLKDDLKMVETAAKKMKLYKVHNPVPLPEPSKRKLEQSRYVLKEEVKEALRCPQFDNWQWDSNELVVLLEQILIDLGVVKEYDIDLPTLRRFLLKIREAYNENPFHNFRHCFCVTQMMYGLLCSTGLLEKLLPIDRFILVTSCIGHDADHPGFNNAYQINALTDLAIIYNDVSPLENHHCAVLFSILRNPETNICKNVKDDVYREMRKGIVRCILATDMGRHGELMTAFKKASETVPYNYDDVEQKLLLMQMVIKCADISNEVRPPEVAEPWVDCLLEEFFTQSDTEKFEGLPTAPFMDREKVTKSNAQVGFIGFVMIPLYELVAKVLPNVETALLNPIRQALASYKEMQEAELKKK